MCKVIAAAVFAVVMCSMVVGCGSDGKDGKDAGHGSNVFLTCPTNVEIVTFSIEGPSSKIPIFTDTTVRGTEQFLPWLGKNGAWKVTVASSSGLNNKTVMWMENADNIAIYEAWVNGEDAVDIATVNLEFK